MDYDTATIRELLKATFNDEKLLIFCFDHFYPVYQEFSVGMSLSWKIQLLLEHCKRHDLLDELLALVQQIDPLKYDSFTSFVKEATAPSRASIASDSQERIVIRYNFSNASDELLSAALGALSDILNIPRDQIHVFDIQGKQVSFEFEMPVVTAKSALNTAPLTRELGIETHFYGPVSGPVHTGSGDIQISLSSFSWEVLRQWLIHLFRWSEAPEHMRSSWTGMVLWSFSAITNRLNPQNWMTVAGTAALWLATAWLIIPFLQWPLAYPQERLYACARYAIASTFIPLLIGLVTTADQQPSFEIRARREHWTLIFLKVTGASIGFAVFSSVLLILAMAVYYFTLSSLPVWLWYILVLLPLFFSYVTARRIPLDRYKMFGGRLQLHDADKLFFGVFLLFGPFLAGFIYWWYDYLARPIMGFIVLLIFIGIALWEQRKRAPTFLSEAATILFVGLILPALGILLFVFFSGQFDSDTLSRLDFYPQLILAMLYVSGLTTLGVTLFLRNRPNLTLQGVLGLLVVVLLLNSVLAFDLTAGRWLTLAIVILWILWGRRRFRHLLWVHTTFPLMLTAIGVSFYLAVVMVIPIWANILGFGFTVAVLVLWAYQSPRLES